MATTNTLEEYKKFIALPINKILKMDKEGLIDYYVKYTHYTYTSLTVTFESTVNVNVIYVIQRFKNLSLTLEKWSDLNTHIINYSLELDLNEKLVKQLQEINEFLDNTATVSLKNNKEAMSYIR